MTNSTEQPAKPQRLQARIDRTAGELRFVYHRRQWGIGCFLGLWLTGWTVGCVVLIGLAFHEPSVFTFLIGLPFWSAWVFTVCVCLSSIFLREQFVLDASGASFLRQVVVTLRRRYVPLHEIKSFKDFSEQVNSESGAVEHGIELQTAGLAIRFGQGLPEQERRWLLHELRHQLAELRLRDDHERPEVNVSNGDPTITIRPPVTETHYTPPSDCRWERDDRTGGVAFTQRGQMAWTAAFTLLFVTLFWNGIVSVFLFGLFGYSAPFDFELTNGEIQEPLEREEHREQLDHEAPDGAMWWGALIFLLPFVAIGLAISVALLFVLLEPLRTTVWNFSDDSIECSITRAGLGRSWNYPVDRLDRLELREHSNRSNTFRVQFPQEGATCRQLTIVNKQNVEVCTIDDLTEGEARWMADVILRERDAWFR
jgi:hypothetical protein